MPDPLLKKSPEPSTSSPRSVKELQKHFNALAMAGPLSIKPPSSHVFAPSLATTRTSQAAAVIDGSLPGRASMASGGTTGPKSPSLSPSILRRAAQLEKTLSSSPPVPSMTSSPDLSKNRDNEQPPSSSSKRGGLMRKLSSPTIPTIFKGKKPCEISSPAIHTTAPSSSTTVLPEDVPFRELAGHLKDFRNTECTVSEQARLAIDILTQTRDMVLDKGRTHRQKPDYDVLDSAIVHCTVIADGGDFWASEISDEIANKSQESILPNVAHDILKQINERIATCPRAKARFYSMIWLTLRMGRIQLAINSFTEVDNKRALTEMLSLITSRCTRLPLPIKPCVPILEKYLPDEQTKNEMRNLGAANLLARLESMLRSMDEAIEKINPTGDITAYVEDIIVTLQKSTQEEAITPCPPSSLAKATGDQTDDGGLERLPSGIRPSSVKDLPLPLGRRPTAPPVISMVPATFWPNDRSSPASSSSDVDSPKPAAICVAATR